LQAGTEYYNYRKGKTAFRLYLGNCNIGCANTVKEVNITFPQIKMEGPKMSSKGKI